MDYNHIYENLISKARSCNRSKKSDTFYEKHHILPKCMGGDNSTENLVLLTPEEHFLAHQLLVKLNPSVIGLLHAVRAMTMHNSGRRIHNKEYGWLRRARSEAMKGIPVLTPEQMVLRANSLRGVPRSPETIAKMSAANKGKPMLESTKARLLAANIGKKHKPESIEKIRAASLGRKMSAEAREKIASSKRGIPRPKEVIEKIAAKRKGVKQTPEAIEARRRGLIGRSISLDHREKISLGKQVIERVEVSPGKFRSLNSHQLSRFKNTGEYRSARSLSKYVAG